MLARVVGVRDDDDFDALDRKGQVPCEDLAENGEALVTEMERDRDEQPMRCRDVPKRIVGFCHGAQAVAAILLRFEK